MPFSRWGSRLRLALPISRVRNQVRAALAARANRTKMMNQWKRDLKGHGFSRADSPKTNVPGL
jgi:hypothetical protein